MRRKRKEFEVGSVLGSLTVTGPRAQEQVPVVCVCGKEKRVNYYNLWYGRTKSCGNGACYGQSHDLTGQVFGTLTVEGYAESRKTGKGGILWWCGCTCGSRTKKRGCSLRSGKTDNCGCLSSTKHSKSKRGRYSFENQLYATYKFHADKRGLPFELSKEDFREFLKEDCHYCGVGPSGTVTKKLVNEIVTFKYNGIDRKDSSKGYTPGNCVAACKICNLAKKDLPYDQFTDWLKRLATFHQEGNNNDLD